MVLDQFILFGDSITQGCFGQHNDFAIGAQLAHDYSRKLDVINRGNSGYNTNDAIRILPTVLPTPAQAHIRILYIFFGTNDAAVTGSSVNQCVDLPVFTQNLRSIITSPLVTAHAQANNGRPIRILLVTPPPIEATYIEEWDRAHDIREIHRTADRTALFAQAVRDVAASFSPESESASPYVSVALVDLWTAIIHEAAPEFDAQSRGDALIPGDRLAPVNARLRQLLPDGIHLSGDGYRVLYAEVKKVIAAAWPEEDSVVLEPAWADWTLPAVEPGHVGTYYPAI